MKRNSKYQPRLAMEKMFVLNGYRWKGFTLVELLVVIAITGVLLAIALPNYLGARERARDAKVKSELNQLKQALRMYYNDYQQYPAGSAVGGIIGCGSNGDELCPVTSGACSIYEFAAGGEGCANVYMKKLPTIPAADGSMKYYQRDNGEGFLLCVDGLENKADPDIEASNARCYGGVPRYCVCSD